MKKFTLIAEVLSTFCSCYNMNMAEYSIYSSIFIVIIFYVLWENEFLDIYLMTAFIVQKNPYMNEEDNRFLCTPCLTLIGWPSSYLCDYLQDSPSPRQLATLRDSISHSISIHLIMLLSTYLSLSLYNHQFFLGKTSSK